MGQSLRPLNDKFFFWKIHGNNASEIKIFL